MRSVPQPMQLSLQGDIDISPSFAGVAAKPAGGLDERFCEVMDAAPVMIWVSGPDKGCVWFNRPWLAITSRGWIL